MDIHVEFSVLLKKAAELLEWDLPSPDAFGGYSIKMEDGFHCSILAPPHVPFVYLAIPILLLDNLDSKPLYRRALEANYMLSDTRGATLAVDPRANQLLVCSRLRISTLTGELLAEEIAEVVLASQTLREDLLAPNLSGETVTDHQGDHPYMSV